MNSFPGPENSWEGVDAYFTWADSPGNISIPQLGCSCNMRRHYLVSCKA